MSNAITLNTQLGGRFEFRCDRQGELAVYQFVAGKKTAYCVLDCQSTLSRINGLPLDMGLALLSPDHSTLALFSVPETNRLGIFLKQHIGGQT